MAPPDDDGVSVTNASDVGWLFVGRRLPSGQLSWEFSLIGRLFQQATRFSERCRGAKEIEHPVNIRCKFLDTWSI
jgi:hypothetical protein